MKSTDATMLFCISPSISEEMGGEGMRVRNETNKDFKKKKKRRDLPDCMRAKAAAW